MCLASFIFLFFVSHFIRPASLRKRGAIVTVLSVNLNVCLLNSQLRPLLGPEFYSLWFSVHDVKLSCPPFYNLLAWRISWGVFPSSMSKNLKIYPLQICYIVILFVIILLIFSENRWLPLLMDDCWKGVYELLLDQKNRKR